MLESSPPPTASRTPPPAPPPAARSELADRVRTAGRRRGAAGAVRAERERDDASRRLRTRAARRGVGRRAVRDGPRRGKREHAQIAWTSCRRDGRRGSRGAARARRDAEAERDAALAKCGEAAADAARADAATRECARLEDEKAPLERAVREGESKRQARGSVAANAVGALDARAVGLDPGRAVPARGGAREGEGQGKGGRVGRCGARGRGGIEVVFPGSPAAAAGRGGGASRVRAAGRGVPDDDGDAEDDGLESSPRGGRRGWNPGGIPPRPIPDPPLPSARPAPAVVRRPTPRGAPPTPSPFPLPPPPFEGSCSGRGLRSRAVRRGDRWAPA